MLTWTRRPIIYEINTYVWLDELSRREKRRVHLGNIPSQDWEAVASFGVDAVWLMGVWERSPLGLEIANRNEGLQADFRRALPDVTQDDIVGSPYCVRRYVVDESLGGPAGLAKARKQLADRGIRLILDFVPNHVAPDHPWIVEHPEFFVQGSVADLNEKPGDFFQAGATIVANGRDPYFAPWPDVAQLNAFNPGLRQAAKDTVNSIADQCDGMRCDMAMLMTNPIFERTWGARAGQMPQTEYWPEVIGAARKRHPHVLFIAEAYWDMEWQLQQHGFDYCYDKRLYDRLEHDGGESVRLHLCADPAYQEKLVRFIENHDEPRAAATFSPMKERAAAVTMMTVPGAKLLHEGQFEGYKTRLPVFLRRRPEEPTDQELTAFYRKLLKAVNHSGLRDADWQLCERSGWPDNPSFQNLVAWGWRKGETHSLVVGNLSNGRSQGQIRAAWDDLRGRFWRLTDAFTGQVYERAGDQLVAEGLYVDLEPWGFHFFSF